jgi:N-acetylmuramic acid 6-phosphate etherase
MHEAARATTHRYTPPRTMPHELERLVTESRHPASARLDEMTAAELVALMSAEDARVAGAVAAQADPIARLIEVTAERLARGGRLIYAGAGTSGRLGVLDAAECPPTFCTDPAQVVAVLAGGAAAMTRSSEGAEDDAAAGERALRALEVGERDVVVGISSSGRTPFVLGAVAEARRASAFTACVCCNPSGRIAGAVDLAIVPVVGPEVLTGSTRLKAGTATKLVLNMVSTGAMVRLGKTYRNWMVDVAPTNEKLRARALRIVAEATGLTPAAAADLLARCGGEVKTSLVAQLGGVAPEAARAALSAAAGSVRRALAALPQAGSR